MNFIPPKPGDSIIYCCTNCKKQFSHKIPEPAFLFFKKKVKCPDCKHLSVPAPFIQY